MKTQNLIVMGLAIFLIVLNPYAQTSSKTPVNSLKGGKWALSFLVGTPSSSGNYGSLNLTLKSQLSKVFAVRLGGAAYLSYGKNTTTSVGFYYNEGNSSNTNAEIFLNFLFYTTPSKPVSFYLGLGPIYQYRESKTEYLPRGTLYNGSYYTSERGYALGGSVILGAEWFAFSRFSLTAEYNLSYTYGVLNGTNTNINPGPPGAEEIDVSLTDSHIQTWNLNIVKLGFSVYF